MATELRRAKQNAGLLVRDSAFFGVGYPRVVNRRSAGRDRLSLL